MKPTWISEDGRVRLYTGDAAQLPETLGVKFDACFCDPPYGLKFMGQRWDHGVPPAATWERLPLKPGAPLLAFGDTRTYHRLTTAVEDAGFEIRDCLMWLYGSGFPKSHDVSKAIDKAAGAGREVVGKWRLTGNARPPKSGPRGHGSAVSVGSRPVERTDGQYAITAPATDLARRFDGYGTALKPAWEAIVLAMKPLEGTFAANAKEHGVAGMNIDGSRVGEEPRPQKASNGQRVSDNTALSGYNTGRVHTGRVHTGRWPANVLLDPDAAESLGSPARFFYCAKASKSEREAGLEREAGCLSGRADASLGGSIPVRRNTHPTVKPLALCEYLARLILPPARGPGEPPRRLIVPFSGSGSEVIGALRAGWDEVVGVERDSGYHRTASARINHHLAEIATERRMAA